MCIFFTKILEIIASKGNENSFYYTYSTLAQVLAGFYAVIGTITLFRLENLFKVRDANIFNLHNIKMDKDNQLFFGQEDMTNINKVFTYDNIEKIALKREAIWQSHGISPIESFTVLKTNLNIIKEIFNQLNLIQATLKKFTTITIYNIIFCIFSLSLTTFIIKDKCWFTAHILVTLCLQYFFLKYFKNQYYIIFGDKLTCLPIY